MMNKCLCENVFTLGATIERLVFTLLCLHIKNRELQRKKKKNEASLAILCNL